MPDAFASDIRSLVTQSWSAGERRSLPDGADLNLVARGVRPDIVRDAYGGQQVHEWLTSLDVPRRSVFMDTTTLSGVRALLSPHDPPVSPLLLWDLATFATNVVCYDRIIFLQATRRSMRNLPLTLPTGVEEEYLNRPFRDAVFQSLIVPDNPIADFDIPEVLGVHALLHDWWDSARRALAVLAEQAGTNSLGGQELDGMRLAWSKALGREIPVSNLTVPFGTWEWPDDDYDWIDTDLDLSPLGANRRTLIPSLMLAQYTRSEGVVDHAFYDNRSGFKAVEPAEPDEPEKHRIEQWVISELNHRAHFNLRAAKVLGLPYGAGLARLPYRRLHVARAISVQQHLYSILAADDAYRKLADQVRPTQGTRIALPVFAAVALARARTTDDIWVHLAELREKGTRFRERRAELDQALEEGDARTHEKLRAAVETESKRLAEHFSPEHISAGIEKTIPHIAGAVIGDIGEQVSVGHSLLRTVLPVDLIKDLHRRLFRLEYAFLMDVRRASASMTNSMPKISRLWHLDNDLIRDEFAARFEAFGELGRN